MPNPSNSTSFRESAIEDMLGKPPGWLLHSGIGAIGVVLIVVLLTTSFIRYPDKQSAPFLLQTETVPLSLHLTPGDIIDTLFATSGTQVAIGDTLLVVRSAGDWKAVANITTTIEDLPLDSDYQNAPSEALLNTLHQKLLRQQGENYPAEVQSALSDLQTTLTAHKSYLATNGVTEKILAYQQEIEQARKLSESLKKQVVIQEEELALEQQQNDRMTQLAKDRVVSQQDAEQATARMLSVKRQQESLVSSDIQNLIRVEQLSQQILELRLNHQETLAEFTRLADAQIRKFRAILATYHNRYILIAREEGVINWQPNVREQALVENGAPIGFIVTENGPQKIVARLQLPPEAQGKTAVGDKVLLELDGYPSREYGQVEGTLASIDPVALPNQENGYLRQATVSLADTIKTSYGKDLTFQYNLSGTAQIITSDRTLLQRILDRFLNLTKNT